jgi:hypothetical protein
LAQPLMHHEHSAPRQATSPCPDSRLTSVPHAPRVTAHCITPQPPGYLQPTHVKPRTHDRTLNVRDLTRRLHAPAHARPTRPHTAPRRCGGCGYEAASPSQGKSSHRGARPQDTLRPSKAAGHRPRSAPAQAQAAPKKQETQSDKPRGASAAGIGCCRRTSRTA